MENDITDYDMNDLFYGSAQPKKRNRVPFQCETSVWKEMLSDPTINDVNSRAALKFKRRFRTPYNLFKEYIVPECNRKNVFNLERKSRIPIELKILSVLRILGRGSCADDINELSGIGESTVHELFKTFVVNFSQRGSDGFYDEWIKPPVGEDLQKVMDMYANMGFPGARGSMDCTHVVWWQCPAHLQNLCKRKYPS